MIKTEEPSLLHLQVQLEELQHGGIAAAIGPMFGGFVTTFLSWRFGFAFELAVIIIIFAYSKNIKNFKPQSRKTNFDLIGGIYSIITLVMLVLGVLELKKNMLLSIVLFIISIVFLRLFISYDFSDYSYPMK